MSDKRKTTRDRDLPPLPSRRSPGELDRRILQYARDHAPRRHGWRPGWWMSGLATASILGVALLIALPPEREATVGDWRETAPRDPVPNIARKAMESVNEEKVQADTAAEAEGFSARTNRAEPPPPEPVLDAAAPAPVPRAPAASSTVLESVAPPGAAPEKTRTRYGGTAVMPIGDLRRELSELTKLRTTEGGEHEAREAYEVLRQRCEQCLLPETLEEALLQYGLLNEDPPEPE